MRKYNHAAELVLTHQIPISDDRAIGFELSWCASGQSKIVVMSRQINLDFGRGFAENTLKKTAVIEYFLQI